MGEWTFWQWIKSIFRPELKVEILPPVCRDCMGDFSRCRCGVNYCAVGQSVRSTEGESE
jgi:hypothetical protein